MTSKLFQSAGRAIAAVAVLLGLGVAAAPAAAGDYGHRHHDRNYGRHAGHTTDQALRRLFIAFLGAPERRHHVRPAKRPARFGHLRRDRSCRVVERTVIDRFGRRAHVVDRLCVEDHGRHHRRRHFNRHGHR